MAAIRTKQEFCILSFLFSAIPGKQSSLKCSEESLRVVYLSIKSSVIVHYRSAIVPHRCPDKKEIGEGVGHTSPLAQGLMKGEEEEY